MAQVFDTIIIGAGWAGAVAARDLAIAGRSVLVLEARDHVGGRARTWVNGDAKIDLGCSWIHGYNEGNPARKIAKDMGVTAHLPKPTPPAIYGPSGPLSPEVAGKLGSTLGAAQAAFRTPHPSPKPQESLADALFSSSSPLASVEDASLAKGFARTLEVPLGLKLERASLKWSGWEGATNFAGSDAAPEGGYEALIGKVLTDAQAHGAVVKVSEPVTSVKETSGGVTVATAQGTYQGRTAICTIPVGVLKDHLDIFTPALPERYAEVVRGVNVGVLEKLLLNYESVWWPRAQEVASYIFLPTSDAQVTASTPLKEVLEASTIITANLAGPALPGATPTLLSYLSDTPARAALALKNPEEVAQVFHDFIKTRLGVTDAPEPKATALTEWLTDPLSQGATTTPSIVSDGERSPMDFKELSRPVWDGRLGFAGEHTEMENRGSVAGAVISGQREAARVDRYLAKHQQ